MLTKNQAVEKMKKEMFCAGCRKSLEPDRPLYYTLSGVYWCGSSECAVSIMKSNIRDEVTFTDTLALLKTGII